MTLDDFVQLVAEQFDDTPAEQFTADTNFRSLEEWGSLVALSIISMVDEEFEKRVPGAELKSCDTIEQLFQLIESK